MRDITIIIPTMGVPERKGTLRRAVESVLVGKNLDPTVVVVVNGDRYRADVLAQFEGEARVRVVYIAEANVSLARLQGRDLVETSYFGFLDDDDAFLPGGLSLRLDAFEADDALDVVATNGLSDVGGVRQTLYDNFTIHEHDPLLALTEVNWLCSCGGLFRTSTVGREIFADLPATMEITLVAFRLSRRHKILRLDIPTFVIHGHDFARLSSSAHYYASISDVLQIMYDNTGHKQARGRLAMKMGSNFHDMAVRAMNELRLSEAWRFHLRSLGKMGGWRYLLFTRHLLRAMIVKSIKGDAAA